MILAAIAVGIQLLLFRSAVAVGVATLVVAAGREPAGARHAPRLRVPHPVEPPPRAVEIDVPLRLRGRRVSDYVPSRALHVQV